MAGMVVNVLDLPRSLRYNGLVKWIRLVIVGVVSLFVLFVIVGNIVWSDNDGEPEAEQRSPTPTNCIEIPVEGGFQIIVESCPSDTPSPTR
jgi:hypothetical protein